MIKQSPQTVGKWVWKTEREWLPGQSPLSKKQYISLKKNMLLGSILKVTLKKKAFRENVSYWDLQGRLHVKASPPFIPQSFQF